jgi:ABC-type polysaccharide/polyol phosphate transport system ATPase subunit
VAGNGAAVSGGLPILQKPAAGNWERPVSEFAIGVHGLRKGYRLYTHPREMLLEALGGWQRHREFAALEDVSFDVHCGSVLGLMGRNGAGKSTLLRITAGTLEPTPGSAITAGRVAGILELGTGFHADYTGRENIYLGGLCPGLTRKRIDSRVAEVIEFQRARRIRRPAAPYLAERDADPPRIQCRDLGRHGHPDHRRELVGGRCGLPAQILQPHRRVQASRGKSILVVSHSINQLVGVCDPAILLDRGRILMDGEPNAVGNAYHEPLFGSPLATTAEPQPSAVASEPCESLEASVAIEMAETVEAATSAPQAGREHRYGDGAARIIDFRLLDAGGRVVTRLQSLETYSATMTIRAVRQTEELCAGVLVRNARGQEFSRPT